MKSLILTLFCLCASQAFADDSESWKAPSPDNRSLAATRQVPDPEYIWKTELDGTRLVVFKLTPDSVPSDLYFDHNFFGRLVAQIAWTPDSKYLVLSTESSGGHSPWHANSYVFSVKDHRLVEVDDSAGLVVSTDFKVIPPHTVAFQIGLMNSDGVDFEHPVTKEVDLSTLFKAAPSN